MTFKRFVQLGRVALINFGPDAGKLCCVIDIQDANKALVDGPGIKRQIITLRRVSLTDIRINIGRNARAKTLAKAFADENVLEKWESTAWAKKIAAKKARAKMNDFERFKVMVARKQKASIIRKKLYELKKSA
mmetsp:Transcript_16676/g.20980  ORF Transcript_16676/g.20980 Transcript_16676/m.20980 type:complete len:133 (+) Transcript_16676:79-477(+)